MIGQSSQLLNEKNSKALENLKKKDEALSKRITNSDKKKSHKNLLRSTPEEVKLSPKDNVITPVANNSIECKMIGFEQTFSNNNTPLQNGRADQ